MPRKVKLFDLVEREFWLDLPDDFDLEADNAITEIIEMTNGMEPVDEMGKEIHIYIDDKEWY